MPGIERELVGRDVKHARIVVEHPLRAVAVMDVDVDDGDACRPVRDRPTAAATATLLNRQNPIAAIALRVMARRADERERRLAMLERMVRSLHGCTSGDERDLERTPVT